MQKKFLALFLALCLLTAMTGCGGDPAPQSSPASEPSSVADVPSSQETPEPPAEEPEPEPEEEGPTEGLSDDWLGSQGLAITPQGSFTFKAGAYDASGANMTQFDVPATMTITESTENNSEGFKTVRMTCLADLSNYNDIENASGYTMWYSAFDRYSGTSLDFGGIGLSAAYGEFAASGAGGVIGEGENALDITTVFRSGGIFPAFTSEIMVTCPVDYDGVVFQVGYSTIAQNNEFLQTDLSVPHTIDQLPYFGDGYYYFSLANE